MNRKTAMLTSGALVLAMLVAGLAVTLGMTGPTAEARGTHTRRKPIVHTTTQTVTIHRPSSETSAPAGSTVITLPAQPVSTQSAEPSDDGTSFEGSDDGSSDETFIETSDGGEVQAHDD